MAEPKIFLKENRDRIEKSYLEQAKNVQRKWRLHVNIYMRLCRTAILAIIRLKYFWTMQRMV